MSRQGGGTDKRERDPDDAAVTADAWVCIHGLDLRIYPRCYLCLPAYPTIYNPPYIVPTCTCGQTSVCPVHMTGRPNTVTWMDNT